MRILLHPFSDKQNSIMRLFLIACINIQQNGRDEKDTPEDGRILGGKYTEKELELLDEMLVELRSQLM